VHVVPRRTIGLVKLGLSFFFSCMLVLLHFLKP
jgi:hypothetical protein